MSLLNMYYDNLVLIKRDMRELAWVLQRAIKKNTSTQEYEFSRSRSETLAPDQESAGRHDGDIRITPKHTWQLTAGSVIHLHMGLLPDM